jgi:hypothetical protein
MKKSRCKDSLTVRETELSDKTQPLHSAFFDLMSEAKSLFELDNGHYLYLKVTVKLEQEPKNSQKLVLFRITHQVHQDLWSLNYTLLPHELDALRRLKVESDNFPITVQTLFLEFTKSIIQDSEALQKEDMMTLIKSRSKHQTHLDLQAIVYNNFTRNYQMQFKRTGKCYSLKSQLDPSLQKLHHMLRYLRLTKDTLQVKVTKLQPQSNKLFSKMNSLFSPEETQKMFYDFVNYDFEGYPYKLVKKSPSRGRNRKRGLASYIGSSSDLFLELRLKNSDLEKLKVEDFHIMLPELVDSVNMSKVRKYLLNYITKPDQYHYQVSLGFQMNRIEGIIRFLEKKTETASEELLFANLTIEIIVYSFKLCRTLWVGSVQLSLFLDELGPAERKYLLRSILYLRSPSLLIKQLQTLAQENVPEIYRSKANPSSVGIPEPTNSIDAQMKWSERQRDDLLKQNSTIERPLPCQTQANLIKEVQLKRMKHQEHSFEAVPATRMKFLGGYKYLQDKSVSYYNFFFRGNPMRVKIKYLSDRIIISAFQAATQQNYKLLVKDLPTVERIIDFVQKSSCGSEQEEFTRSASLLLFDRRKEQKGIIFCVNDMFSRTTSVLVDSSPSHMKYNILTEFSNVYIDNFFVKKTLFFSSITKNLGSNYVTAKLFYSFKLEINQLIVLLIISPSKNRFKAHKLIMNNFDLKSYFNLDLLSFVHDERRLLILLNEVMEKLVTYKDVLYTKIVIPSVLVKRVNPTKYNCILTNVFDQRTLFKSNTQQNMDPRAKFLEERILNSEVICKGVKRISNQYWIFIVSKNRINDRYDFSLYNQMSKRLYTASMSHHDTYRMSDQYIYNIFKHSYDEIQQIEAVSTSFVHFEEQLIQIETFQNKPTKKTGLKSKMLELQNKRGGYEMLLNQKKKNFSEMKFWMDTIELATLYNKNCNLMLCLDTYTSVLKEQVWMSVVKDADGSFEMNLTLVSSSGSKTNELSPIFRPIRHDELVNHILLLRIVFFDKSLSHNDKISLQQLFTLYKEPLAEKIRQTHLMASPSAQYDGVASHSESDLEASKAKNGGKLVLMLQAKGYLLNRRRS